MTNQGLTLSDLHFDYFERITRCLPEAANMWRAQSPEGFCHVSEKLLGNAITHLEEHAKDYQSEKILENAITAAAIGFFKRYGVRASSQTNSRGHVDIYIRHEWLHSLVICGEAKIWRGTEKHIKGLGQVLGYATGRVPHCFLVVYVRTGKIDAHRDRLKSALNALRPEQQQEDCSDHGELRWALVSNHAHSSGCIVTVLHAAVNLVCE